MLPANLTPFLPTRINTGPWLAGYSLDALKARVATDRIVLPICSLGTPPEALANLAPLVLPPLYHEALDADLKLALLAQIRRCFPFYIGTRARENFRGTFDVCELPAQRPARGTKPPRILAFGVDTTIEQHGPHLPLGTDTIQSYAVLHRLASEIDGLVVGPPLDYGHLTWGLPFGLSIDLTPPLVSRYMTGFVNAVMDWLSPESLYVADVHGSLVHRNAIQDGLRHSRCRRWVFRWLHEPLVEFAGGRGDAHAGGVETVLVEHIRSELVDSGWWPHRIDDLAAAQMPTAEAIELSSDLPQFIERVESRQLNGIVGRVHNAINLDARELMNRMLNIARTDVASLISP
jgi:creatinine amidohydrolase/Fe(II)-dependent formamide hydrolase-like protein